MTCRVRLSPRGAGCEILLDAVEKRNALDAAMWSELADRLREAADTAARFLVLRGAGPSFCAGGDLKAMRTELRAPQGPEQFRARIHDCLDQLYRFPAPTVASVQGSAVGGGLELALACDLRVVAASSVFRMPAARFGMVMAVPELRRLAAVVGWSWARAIVITAAPIDSERAHRIGLAHYVCPDEELVDATQAVLDGLADMEPDAVRWSRRALTALAAGEPTDDLLEFETACFRRSEFWDRLG